MTRLKIFMILCAQISYQELARPVLLRSVKSKYERIYARNRDLQILT
jgi:hypothetical protein